MGSEAIIEDNILIPWYILGKYCAHKLIQDENQNILELHKL